MYQFEYVKTSLVVSILHVLFAHLAMSSSSISLCLLVVRIPAESSEKFASDLLKGLGGSFCRVRRISDEN